MNLKISLFFFLASFCLNSLALSPNECREIIRDTDSIEGRAEWLKCLFSDRYVREVAKEPPPVVEYTQNRVFDFYLGGNAIAQLKKLSDTKKVTIGLSNCSNKRCELNGFINLLDADFVFKSSYIFLFKDRPKLDGYDFQRSYKQKTEISENKRKPSLTEIGVQVIKVTVGLDVADHYHVYIKDDLIIGVKPIKEFGDDLPIDKDDLINLLNSKYRKLETQINTTEKSEFFVTTTYILRWKFNDEVEIRLYSNEGVNTNYSACTAKFGAINRAINTNMCIPKNKNLLLYSLNESFDALESVIKIKQNEITESLWDQYMSNKKRF